MRNGWHLAYGASAILILSLACTVRWISTYDETTDKGVTALEQKVDELFSLVGANPPASHAKVEPQYQSIYRDLQLLIVRNEARDKNELTTQQLRLLDSNLRTFEKLHADKDFTRELVPPAKATIDQIFRAILKLELAKKEG